MTENDIMCWFRAFEWFGEGFPIKHADYLERIAKTPQEETAYAFMSLLAENALLFLQIARDEKQVRRIRSNAALYGNFLGIVCRYLDERYYDGLYKTNLLKEQSDGQREKRSGRKPARGR